MKIQLFLADQEVELTNEVSFPLNRSFEHLNDPTSILVEYSKTISIPITKKNNRLFGNIYRLDRTIVASDGNMGFYFDPTKRIPARLVLNGRILLDGYAKFTSSNYSTANKSYNVNLYGKLGDIFKELRNVVTNEGALGELDEKYLIKKTDYCTSSERKLDRNFIEDSFTANPNCWDSTAEDGMHSKLIDIHDVLGFAPSHRGLYSDFSSTKIQTDLNTIKEMSEVLKLKWTDTLKSTGISEDTASKIAEQIGASDVVGSGFKDYEMFEFRSYKMKPYIYFNQLMRIFAKKCKSLTGYEFNLDRNWFNVNNPYWSRMCYMLDYLDTTKTVSGSGVKEKVFDKSETFTVSNYEHNTSKRKSTVTMDVITLSNGYNLGESGCSIAPFDVDFGCLVYKGTTGKYTTSRLTILPETQVFFKFDIYKGNPSGGWEQVGTTKYWTNGSMDANVTAPVGYNGYDANNYLNYSIYKENSYEVSSADVTYRVSIPQLNLTGDFSNGLRIALTVNMYNSVGYPENSSSDETGLFVWDSVVQYEGGIKVAQDLPIGYNKFSGLDNAFIDFYAGIGPVYTIKDWRENTIVDLSNLYKKSTPLFDVILQYTKMFGLHWDIDYDNKKVNILTRSSVFKDYTVTNWDDKIDRSRDFIVEPVVFQDNNIVFNYDDKDGNIYSGYRDKFGVNIGEKVLYTKYEFNSNEKDLFKDIHPSSASSKSFISFSSLYNWDTKSMINPVAEQHVFIDCENEDCSGAISLNNWYLRGDNVTNDEYIISDDSALMTYTDTPCFYMRDYALSAGTAVKPSEIPLFSIAVRFNNSLFDNVNTYGCVFNTPNEDYTCDKSVSNIGGYNIYEQFWKDYINERYNVQNKKLTAYVYLTNKDFSEFRFNKFVVINNQLLMVNKIIDYNPNSNGSTKVEFIQINDVSKLSTKTFKPLMTNASSYVLKGSSDPASPDYSEFATAVLSVPVYGLPVADNITVTGDISSYLTNISIGEHVTNGISVNCMFSPLVGVFATGKLVVSNSIGDKTEINITVDFREYILF